MSKKEFIKRYMLFILGLFTMAVGVALMVQARLGTSPISSVPYVFSLKLTKLSLGTLTFLWNMILILGQILILGKDFKKYQLIQIPLSVLFGVFVDGAKFAVRGINPGTYGGCMLVLGFGILALAFGVSFTVIADVVLNSGEGFVKAVSVKTGHEFGSLKVVFDVSLVLISVITAYMFFRNVAGVREGTIIAAVASGFIIKCLNKQIKPPIDKWIMV